MGQNIFFTIVANNYGAYALTLMRSIAEQHPDSTRYIILCDRFVENSPQSSVATTILASDIGLSDFSSMAFHYDVMEFSTAIKPPAFLWLGQQHPGCNIVYLDPDILVTAPLIHIENALDEGASLVLTPHLTAPLQDGALPDDLTIMKSGIYNLGFAGLRMTSESKAFVEWWRDRCERDAIVDIADNKFTDQRWVDMAPAFVCRTHILHNHSYNLAYWNLAHRRVAKSDDTFLVDGEPLRFVHFSGVSPADPSQFSKHQNRFTASTIGDLRFLLEHYIALVLANGWTQSRTIPYAFGKFEGGRKIHPFMRLSFRRHRDQMTELPFVGDGELFDEAEPELASFGPPNVTRVMYEMWHRRTDLQQSFDLNAVAGRQGFLDWFTDVGGAEAGCDDASLKAAAAIGSRAGRSTSAPSPWARHAFEISIESRREVDGWLAGPVSLNFIMDRDAPLVPRQLALVWQQRPDLQSHFPCQTAQNLRDFLTWGLTNGIHEEAVYLPLIEPTIARYIDYVTTPSSGSTPPITRLMTLMSGRYDGNLPAVAAKFPTTESSLYVHALWIVGKSSRTYGWTPSLTAHIREWGARRATDFIESDVPISNWMTAILHLRGDVREALDMSQREGQLSFLAWLISYGMREMDLPLNALAPELFRFLAMPAPLKADGTRMFHQLVRERRGDLHAFDLDTQEGLCDLVAALSEEKADEWSPHAWLDQLASDASADPSARTDSDLEHADLTDDARPDTDPRIPARHAPVASVLLTGLVKNASGRGEDVRMSDLSLRSQHVRALSIDRYQDAGTIPPVRLADKAVNIVHLNAETALTDYLFLRRVGISQAYTIGYWAWELSLLPAEWKQAFAFYDEIWASTQFAYDSIKASSDKPVFLVPMAVEMPKIDEELDRSYFGIPDDAFVFYFGFDLRSFYSRKNPQACIAAFRDAFRDSATKVVLFIKTLGAEQHPADMAALLNAAGGDPRIVIQDREYTSCELTTLVSLCDSFVSLHRSEGFGRGPAEAMLLGKPVIATGYSGNMDFMNTDNSMPVNYQLVPVQEGQYPGWRDQVWAEADIGHAAACMHRVANDPDLARRLGENARETIERLYSAEASGRAIVERLTALQALS